MAKNKKTISRKDFETFQFGVERLKELGNDLNSLDTRKFPVEVAIIRSKLKNVSEIPDIERRLKILKYKIKGSYHPARKKSVYKKVGKELGKVKNSVEDIMNQVLRLNSELNTLKNKIKYSTQEKEILKLESQISYLKSKITKIEKSSKANPKLVRKIKKLSNKIKKQEDNFYLGKDVKFKNKRELKDIFADYTSELEELGSNKKKKR